MIYDVSLLGGHSTFFGFLNTFVHIIMYTYYLLSALGPHMQRYLWWKKYLTTLQMVTYTPALIYELSVNICVFDFRFSLYLSWCTHSNYCSSNVIIRERSSGGSECMLSCSSSSSMNSTNRHTSKNKERAR